MSPEDTLLDLTGPGDLGRWPPVGIAEDRCSCTRQALAVRTFPSCPGRTDSQVPGICAQNSSGVHLDTLYPSAGDLGHPHAVFSRKETWERGLP